LGEERRVQWRLDEHTDPFLNGMPERLVTMLRQVRGSVGIDTEPALDRFQALIVREAVSSPEAFDLAMAVLIVKDENGGLATFDEAVILSQVYHDLSGRAEPILLALRLEGGEVRLPLGFRAIRGPVDAPAAIEVFTIACAQGGVALAAARERSTVHLVAGYTSIFSSARATLREAIGLTGGNHRRELEGLSRELDGLLSE
jgi:hypothetical protein